MATYHVKTTGNDSNPGTDGSPFLTISKGVSVLVAGDTLYIHVGTYSGSLNTVRSAVTTVPGGTDYTTGAINISAFPGDTVTMRPPDGVGAIELTSTTQKYLIFSNLIINGNLHTSAAASGLIYGNSGANHIRFSGCEIKNAFNNGVHIASAGVGTAGQYFEFLGCSVHDNGGTSNFLAGYGYYIEGNNNLIQQGRVYNNNGYGIHQNGNSVAHGFATQANNNIYDRIFIYDNYNRGTSGGNNTSYGIVMMDGATNVAKDLILYGNQGGILFYNGSNGDVAYNCTLSDNNVDVGFGLENAIEAFGYSTPPIVKNVIMFGNGIDAINDLGGTLVQSNNLTTDPLFVNAAAEDYHLQTGSAAIGAGATIVSVTVDFYGIAWTVPYDIGAVKYMSPSVPTNISFATATDLVSLPQTITQQADDAGTTYDLYYRIPASLVTSSVIEIGIFGFGDLTIYTPTTRVYLGPAGAPTQIVRPGPDDPAGLNIPIQVPVDSGSEYFIKVSTNGGNPTPANLTLLVQAANNDVLQAGDIAVPDDTVLYPLCIMSGTVDYVVRKFVHPYSESEQGDVLHTFGNTLMSREPGSSFIDKLAFFNSDYTLNSIIAFSPAIGNTEPYVRTNQTTQHFWVMYSNDPTLYAFYIDKDGVSSAVENLGNVGDIGEAAGPHTSSPTESILYWVPRNDSVIHRWDLVNHIALSDFQPLSATHRATDLLTLSNGQIIVGYFKATATLNFNAKHFDIDGTLLHTYDFGSDISNSVPPRLAHSPDNITSFYVYIPRPNSGANRGKSNVYKVQVSDGTLLITRTYAQFNQGEYEGAATATPFADFGISRSCPFWVIASPTTPGAGLYKLTGTNINNARINHDRLWVDASLGTTEDVAIPNPFAESYLVGDE